MQKLKFEWAKYFAFITLSLEWGSFIVLPTIFNLSTQLPISQVSSEGNPSKPWVFALMLTAAVCYSVAGLYFNNFYDKSFAITIIAGVFFSLVPIIPYDNTQWIWAHLVSASTCAILYIYLVFASSRSSLLKPELRRLFKIIYITEILFILGIAIFYKSNPGIVLTLEVFMVTGIHLWTIMLCSSKPILN